MRREDRCRVLYFVVDGCVPTSRDNTNTREEALSFALDQRAFGPRRLVVAFSDRNGRFRGLAYAPRTDPPEHALDSSAHASNISDVAPPLRLRSVTNRSWTGRHHLTWLAGSRGRGQSRRRMASISSTG